MTGFSLDEGTKHVTSNANFKGKSGETYRFSFVAFDKYDKDSIVPAAQARPYFETAKRLYAKEPVKRFVIADDPNIEKFILQTAKLAEKPAKQYFITVVCSWPLQKNGKLSSDLEDNYQLFYWVLSEDKFKSILKIHKMSGLHEVDLNMTCKDDVYQKMEFLPEKDSALRKVMSDESTMHIAKDILTQAKKMTASMKKELGMVYSLDQLRDMCNMPLPGSSQSLSSYAISDDEEDESLNFAVKTSLDSELDNLDV